MAEETAQAVAPRPTEQVQDDYFGVDETHRHFFPDGVSYVEHKTLAEGDRRSYLNKINREVNIDRATNNASIRTAPGDERYELLKLALVGWNLKRNGQAVNFAKPALEDFLRVANPRLVDDIEKAVRLANPWLLQDISVEDIDKQIADLQELRAKKVEEEEGKESSNAS